MKAPFQPADAISIKKFTWMPIQAFLIILLASSVLHSQDLIIQKEGPDISGSIVEVQDCDVIYKQGDQELSISKLDIFMIIYSDGRQVNFSGENLKECKKATTSMDGLKGPNGRRPFRQLGFPVLYREFKWDVPDAYRVGIYYSSGHIKETTWLGYLMEFGVDVYRLPQGFPVVDNDFVTGFLNAGLIFKIFKNDKWLVYAKGTGGIVAVAYFFKPEGGSYEYDSYIWDVNYNAAAGVNYKLGRKVGLFIEGGYSRVHVLMFGLSFMRH